MSDSTAQDPTPPLHQRYTAVRETALNFIHAQTLDEGLPERLDFATLRTFCAPSFHHSWGHNYAVSRSPPLQGTLSFEGFASHLKAMLPKLESFKAVVTDVVVDPVAMKVVLRVSFWMRARGAADEDVVENDLLWGLEMEEVRGSGGGEVKIKKSVEFVDGAAAGRLGEIMGAMV